jgi:hypothetical protein
MFKLYEVLFELAKSDYRAANILAQNHLYAQAIYFYSQSFEKSTKSVIAFYMITYSNKNELETSISLKRTHGHKLSGLTADIVKLFVEKDAELYVSRGGKRTDDFIQNAHRSIENILRII